MKTTLLLLFSLLLGTAHAFAANDAPSVVNYQGKLLNSAGANVTDGTYTIAFKIYSAPSGATALWAESQSVVVSAGYFNVMLGEGGSAIAGATYTSIVDALGNTITPYLGITITADGTGAISNPSEITPRMRFLSSPYALIAARAKLAEIASSATNAQTLGGLDASRFLQPQNTAASTLNGPLNMTSANLSSTLTVAGAATMNTNLTVKGTLAATATTNGGFVPVGGIIMWSGNSSSLPDGWALCNGSGTYLVNGVSTAIPNLQDKFIVGAGGAYAAKATGGATTATLSTANIPDFRVTYADTYHTEAGAAGPPVVNGVTQTGPDGLGAWYDDLGEGKNKWKGSGDSDYDNRYMMYVMRYSRYWRSGGTSPGAAPTAVNTTPPYYALAFIIRVK